MTKFQRLSKNVREAWRHQRLGHGRIPSGIVKGLTRYQVGRPKLRVFRFASKEAASLYKTTGIRKHPFYVMVESKN